MNGTDARYADFSLVKEMLESPDVIRRMDVEAVKKLAGELTGINGPFLLSGEGSSRIFPAKRARIEALRRGSALLPVVEGATQALEYPLAGGVAFVASNSGKTKEGLRLVRSAKKRGITSVGIVANAGTPIADEADHAIVLSCGPEAAVAATKSVIEQALVYHTIFAERAGFPVPGKEKLASALDAVLHAAPEKEIVDAVTKAKTLFWAGRNDGVAEELTLKTNEISRKRSDFLEGTYAVHGIEEVMTPDDVVILVNPFPEEEAKLKQTLADGVGLTVVAIASRQTSFPTFVIPALEGADEYLQLAAGWNLLVEVGINCGVKLDQTTRARKVGNEMETSK
jgi:glucosamine--fructose-6-phosphate aminotransferase (isomerizing)